MKQANTFNRILSSLLIIAILLSVLPVQIFGATVNYNASRYRATITVTDNSGRRVTGAKITVTCSGDTHTVQEGTNGQYYFSRHGNNRNHTYTITVEADGYETGTTTMKGNSTRASVQLTPIVTEVIAFRVYYTADGHIPSNGYSATNDPADYGPSADDTPLVLINVDITKLKEIAKQPNSPVVYGDSNLASGNQWEFVPRGSHTDADYLEKISAFWEAVLSCTDEESIEAFKETGLFSEYKVYCLKKQSGGSFHADGILDVTPPVYVVELYENTVFFGGGVTDSASNSKFLTAYDILDQYEAHLKQVITWVEDENGKPKLNENNEYTGTYVDTATNKIHNIAVFQTNKTGAKPVEGSEIPYVKQTNTYYLAQFNMDIDEGKVIKYLVTYTDGVENEVIFNEHEYAAERYQTVPAFTGVTLRENYNFRGWYLEGSTDGKIYTDAEISQMSVNSDMTFHAVWVPVPKYTGTVKIVINGKYDAPTQTLLSGTMADLSTPLKLETEPTVYLSSDEQEYILLSHTETGVYSAQLKNGIYHAYYSVDGGETYTKLSDQPLIMESQDRTRYIFYHTVLHNLNGGMLNGSYDDILEYFPSDVKVMVCDKEPVREGYIFDGWLTNDGIIHRPGDVLTESITRPYTVTAQWIKATNVYAHIILDHFAVDGTGYNPSDSKHNVTFTIDQRESAEGDYTEIYHKTINWDGKSEYTSNDYSYRYAETSNENKTTYVAQIPNLTNVSSEFDYTVTSAKSGYMVKSIEKEYDQNGNLHIYFTMQFDPNEFDFVYTVELDDKAKTLPKELWPVAVNVKVTCFENGLWIPIIEHAETYERVTLGQNGIGHGQYPVWMASTDDLPQNYYYRIEVVSYEMPDGRIVAAENIGGANTNYDAVDKSYLSVIEISGGKDPDTADADALTGVYYEDVQVGTVKAIVSIPVYTVTFIPNGGRLDGSLASKVLENQIVMPNTSDYVPERDGGYVFEGWYILGENGEMVSEAVSGSAITSDVNLIAKWKEPVTVEGIITVGATYEQQNDDGSVTLHYVPDNDRVTSVLALLQKKHSEGYYETVDWKNISVDYSNYYYYFQKTEDLLVPVGVGFYSFYGLPDDGSEYRVYILSSNYSATYQNEPESLTQPKKYDTYQATDYDALWGTQFEKIATVNAHMHFEPQSFDLDFKVDATAIGESFRPDKTEVTVTCDVDPAITESYRWPVITQMIFGEEIKGCDVVLTDGVGNGVQSVWKNGFDGTTLYDYGICIVNVDDAPFVEDNPYYYIEYQAPAHFDSVTNDQSQLLVANLIPRTYKINYQTNGGIILGSHVSSHTWSYETTLSHVVPVREGYHFMGWYTDEQLTTPLTETTIDASVANDITYYAKWQQTLDDVHMEIIINHSTDDGGICNDYNKNLTVFLTHRLREDTQSDFIRIDGQVREYDKGTWHNQSGDHTIDYVNEEDVFTDLSSEFDYNLYIHLDGHYVNAEKSTVVKEVHEDGSTTHHVKIYLEFDPDLVNIDFTVEMAENVQKALYPVYANVKVTAWTGLENGNWQTITQHSSKTVEVAIDQSTGMGYGSYPVWQWYNKEFEVPYFYRIEVASLELIDGSVVSMEEIQEETVYSAAGYTATVFAENGCEIPTAMDDDDNIVTADTTHKGAFGAYEDESYNQIGTLRAVIDICKVVFHANNTEADCYDQATSNDMFRTYYNSAVTLPQGEYYSLNQDGTINQFYDIPTFDYNTHNEYIFKGWYTAPDDSGEAIDWSESYEGNTDLYAHWIKVGSVMKDAEDTKQTSGDSYAGYDLIGAQIRDSAHDSMPHYGNPGSGLRFITVLSEDVYNQINAIKGNQAGAEYGFAVAKTSSAQSYAGNTEGYEIEYNGKNVNGVNTTASYKYVKNMKCSGVVDHFNGEDYRLYTAVITYNNLQGDALEAAYATPFVARSYIRYYDANGLLRTYYNNYTGTQLFSSCNTSFAQVRGIIADGNGGAE